uniref:non-specific serine/threonine protein kinase n=1 Tax=Oryza brachyantha TaxID=4533 RepID=J3N929_ORYBR
MAIKDRVMENPERGGDCCRWRGVTCSGSGSHPVTGGGRVAVVVELRLSSAGLGGHISPSILSLEHLEHLDLSRTRLYGTDGYAIPEFFGSFKNLRYLNLSHTSFTGALPPQLGNLSSLECLDVSGTYGLWGEVPPQLGNLSNLRRLNLGSMYATERYKYAVDLSWLSHLHLLEYLDMSNVNLSMVVDWPRVFSSMPSLQALHVSSSSLPGTTRSLAQVNLTNLVELDVSFNNFGRPIETSLVPEWFGSMKNMRYLDLAQTSILSGRVPPQIGNLSNLRHLDLSFMHTDMYSTDISWLTHLHHLEYLNLNSVNLSAVTDQLPLVVNTIPSLKFLILWGCSLSSANQTLTHINLTKLEELHLSGNNFGHPIASGWFWKLTSIEILDLAQTYLYGPFPDALGGMVSLRELYFDGNGNAATMTIDLKNLCQLRYLTLDGSLSSGTIAEFVQKLPRCSPSPLKFLSLQGNNLTGMLPNDLSRLSNIGILDLNNNSISGAIPVGLQNLTWLDAFFVSSNQLTGQIPELPKRLRALDVSMNFLSGNLPSNFSAPNLEVLIMSYNHIAGQVPESVCQLQNIKIFDVSDNFLQGEFPLCFRMSNLHFLNLGGNGFSGEFPLCLQSMLSLTFLDLAQNSFHGTLPEWIADLENLRYLQLSHNMFYGDIPSNITNLDSLQFLHLADNNISGSIPESLVRLKSMTLKRRSRIEVGWGEDLIGEYLPTEYFSLVMKHQELNYGATGISNMVSIDLSLNHLTGGIPDEITFLDGLLNLNLSWNHLSGKIPDNIGAMKSLESLDLSRNNISGEIPASLPDLTYLSSMDLSYNNLVGIIPWGSQLSSLFADNPSMYDGNNGLCGIPYERICSDNNAEEVGSEKRSVKEIMFFYFGLVSGFVVGLWVVFCTLLFKRSWRVSYFRQFNKLCDKAYVFFWCYLCQVN